MKRNWQRMGTVGFLQSISFLFGFVITETSEGLHIDTSTAHTSSVEPLRNVPEMWNTRTRSPGDIRCFCNLPVCVATGYMCKSEGGGCFSDLEDYADVYRAKHGCLELLDRVRHDQCQQTYNRSHPQVLWCCHKDMCNHIDSPENKLKFNSSFPGSTLNMSEDRLYLNGPPQTPPGYNNNNEEWFKAATIAVPICGALILFILIALAIKILRRDTIGQDFIHEGKHSGGILPPRTGHALVLSSNRKPNQYHLQNLDEVSSKKVPLLLQHRNESTPTNSNLVVPSSQCIMLMHPNSVLTQTKAGADPQFEKNEANAKLNLVGKPCLLTESGLQQSLPNDYALLVHSPQQKQDLTSSPINLLHKPNNTTANSNIYQNVNLALGGSPSHHVISPANGKLYDKQRLTSVVTWGEAAGSASHV